MSRAGYLQHTLREDRDLQRTHRLSIAPMMEWTDRHCRFFHRLLTRRALLYTEMITTAAVLRGDRARLLGFNVAEHPIAVQLGGSDPRALAECAAICADLGYDEINLNVGCPSDRVREGRFGACLMAEQAVAHLSAVDGVMMGRAAYQEPWRLLAVEPLIYGAPAPYPSPKAAIEAFIPYAERELARGTRLHAMTRHVLGLFQGVPGARAFRRHIATHAVKPNADIAVLRDALALVVDARAELAQIAA